MHARKPKFWGTARVGAELGVTAGAVSKWIDRYANTTRPFPAPDVEIEEPDGRVTRGWAPARLPEIRQWKQVDRHAVRRPGNPQLRQITTEDQFVAQVDTFEITARVTRVARGRDAGTYPRVVVRNGADGVPLEWDLDRLYEWVADLRGNIAIEPDNAALADALEAAAEQAEDLAQAPAEHG